VNAAEVLSDQGRLDEAEPIFRSALQVARASLSPARIADVSVHLGRLLARKGEFDEAQELLAAARDHFAQVGDKAELFASDARMAECLLLATRPDEALALADSTFERAAVTEGCSLLMPLIGRLRGYALMQLGHGDAASDALQESLSAARELKMDYEVGLTLSALVALAETTGSPDDGAKQERDAIFRRLGVVAAPVDS
jgi:tetratricopeptide (TPR) repeat protein